MLSGILSSAEFYNHAQTVASGGTADQNFVAALYQLVLNRSSGAWRRPASWPPCRRRAGGPWRWIS